MKKICPLLLVFYCFSSFGQKAEKNAFVKIIYTPGHPVNAFKPALSLGAAFDGHEQGETDLILKSENIKAMISSGYKPLSYRLRTELANEVWHWNPHGSWSDAEKKQGYWTSSDNPVDFISMSHSYRLPRRGNTYDQGDDDGYSRIDDGNENTFWKSNPYLDEYFSETRNHPQWIVVDLGKEKYVNAIKISWGQPYATSFTVEFAVPSIYTYFIHFGYYEIPDSALWKPFAHNLFINQTGNDNTIRLSDIQTKARFIRIRMTAGSHTALTGSSDVRDSLGYAIKELEIGKVNNQGSFIDFIHHRPNSKRQSKIYVSSTDCWHRAVDMNQNTEQAGIDRIYQSGLTNSVPTLIPVGLLYDTPENAFALINYLEKKHYQVGGVELGEEADGQFIAPEDYADLYVQWAKKILKAYPEIPLGGPSLQAIILNQRGELFSTQKWLNRFYNFLETHHATNFFDFLSFEWYPYDNICDSAGAQLIQAPRLLARSLKDIRESIIPNNIPLYISEYGYSAFSGRSEVSIEGALMNADIVGSFMTLGGSKTFLYGLEPGQLERNDDCSSYGNNMLFGRDDNGKIIYKTATYYGFMMLTHYWAQAADKMLEIYPTYTNIPFQRNKPVITAYALRCADSTWSLLLINKDPANEWNIDLKIFNQNTLTASRLHFPIEAFQFSEKQYQWQENGAKGFPFPDLPPEKIMINERGAVTLLPYSLTVLKEINR